MSDSSISIMKNNIDISGWQAGQQYKKFDVAFFSGYDDSEPTWATGCTPQESGYYYAEVGHTSTQLNAPTGNSLWTREFPSKP